MRLIAPTTTTTTNNHNNTQQQHTTTTHNNNDDERLRYDHLLQQPSSGLPPDRGQPYARGHCRRSPGPLGKDNDDNNNSNNQQNTLVAMFQVCDTTLDHEEQAVPLSDLASSGRLWLMIGAPFPVALLGAETVYQKHDHA